MAREAGRQAPAVDGQAPSEAGQPAKRSPSLLEQLRANPRAFSFVQAVRLLRQAHGGADSAQAERFLRERLRVRSLLSLGFPATDLTDLEDLPAREEGAYPDQGRFRLTATFLGLYGPSSPLPTFYTEELLDEQSEDRTVSRDFLDVVGDGFFTLFFLAWTRHRLSLKAWEEHDAATMERLFSLVGLGDPEIRSVFNNPVLLLRSAGLLTQFPHSAAGLRGLLADRVGAPVRMVQCVSRNVPIPEDQRCILGHDTAQLGESAWIGSQVRDDTGKFRLEIGPLGAKTFHEVIPGGQWSMAILRLVRFYCTEPLEFDVLLRLDPAEAEDARLGIGTWSQLGCDAWLGRAGNEEPRALFTNLRQEYDRNQQRSVA